MLPELAALAGIAFALGMRHALDVDHLATIDGLTRGRAPRSRAEGCGLWFSVGHGLTILAMATALAAMGRQAAAPAWLASFGPAVAVGTLLLLGSLNLWRAKRAAPMSLRQWLLHRLGRQLHHPLGIAGLGGLFALSFDAFGAAALFAASADSLGLPWAATAQAGTFALGMAMVDGLAGWCSAWLLRRSHALAPGSPRVSALLLGLGCLLAAAALLAEPWLTRTAGFTDAEALLLSAGVGLLVPLSYAAARWGLPRHVARPIPACKEHPSHD